MHRFYEKSIFYIVNRYNKHDYKLSNYFSGKENPFKCMRYFILHVNSLSLSKKRQKINKQNLFKRTFL